MVGDGEWRMSGADVAAFPVRVYARLMPPSEIVAFPYATKNVDPLAARRHANNHFTGFDTPLRRNIANLAFSSFALALTSPGTPANDRSCRHHARFTAFRHNTASTFQLRKCNIGEVKTQSPSISKYACMSCCISAASVCKVAWAGGIS